eukprot:CAMPEP_0116946418 /NCGR_PEP_ID=MMETSP0467-20121206/36969_1 /TAXON_ID=283647 /ORGANISM="Mesodinium pulex, Strain SPMC105" /LENGTH=56 /DNA_ID=CAMNT_0004630183 /DNA_START=829 /DNA_END=999 /DNA_ORIENTATION=-
MRFDELFIVGGSNNDKSAIAECERFSLLKRTSRLVQRLKTERSSFSLELALMNDGD